MIEMFKSNTISVLFKIDMQGIEAMLKYLKTVSKQTEKFIPILYLEQEKQLVIKLDSDLDEIIIRENIIEMYMVEEELKYMDKRLKNSLICMYFYPAEMCERRYNKRYISRYCNIIF